MRALPGSICCILSSRFIDLIVVNFIQVNSGWKTDGDAPLVQNYSRFHAMHWQYAINAHTWVVVAMKWNEMVDSNWVEKMMQNNLWSVYKEKREFCTEIALWNLG